MWHGQQWGMTAHDFIARAGTSSRGLTDSHHLAVLLLMQAGRFLSCEGTVWLPEIVRPCILSQSPMLDCCIVYLPTRRQGRSDHI